MRRAEPYEPEVAAALAAIDATLAGEPVEPEHAELAELSLILRAQRPELTPERAASLDQRVDARTRDAGDAARRRRWRWQWVGAPVALAAAVALVVVIGGSGSGGSFSGATFASSSAASAGSSASGGRLRRGCGRVRWAERAVPQASSTAASAPAALPPAQRKSAAPFGTRQPPAPATTGNRQVVQSAQLSLTTAPKRIDQVAQEVFDVVDREQGNVVELACDGHRWRRRERELPAQRAGHQPAVDDGRALAAARGSRPVAHR